jgi:hypothetical protein
MGAPRIQVATWDVDRQPVGRALVLPGRAYTVDHPLLYWTCQVLAGAGWQITAARWEIDAAALAEPDTFVERAADELDRVAPPAPCTLVVAKSFGTRAAGWASERALPAVWLTPLLTEPRVVQALSDSPAPGLLVGGSVDELWSSTAAHAIGMDVLEVPDADHALHVTGDWRASVEALRQVLQAVEAFAAQVVRTPRW